MGNFTKAENSFKEDVKELGENYTYQYPLSDYFILDASDKCYENKPTLYYKYEIRLCEELQNKIENLFRFHFPTGKEILDSYRINCNNEIVKSGFTNILFG